MNDQDKDSCAGAHLCQNYFVAQIIMSKARVVTGIKKKHPFSDTLNYKRITIMILFITYNTVVIFFILSMDRVVHLHIIRPNHKHTVVLTTRTVLQLLLYKPQYRHLTNQHRSSIHTHSLCQAR